MSQVNENGTVDGNDPCFGVSGYPCNGALALSKVHGCSLLGTVASSNLSPALCIEMQTDMPGIARLDSGFLAVLALISFWYPSKPVPSNSETPRPIQRISASKEPCRELGLEFI